MSAYLQLNIFLVLLCCGAFCGLCFYFYNKLKIKKPFSHFSDILITLILFGFVYGVNVWLNNGIISFWGISAVILGFVISVVLFANFFTFGYTKSVDDDERSETQTFRRRRKG
ncbi:MAG: hypothetical protein FWD32_02120 [Firmicutes bacterium]|nr:hypothetical protein [Bacillota bacterium]